MYITLRVYTSTQFVHVHTLKETVVYMYTAPHCDRTTVKSRTATGRANLKRLVVATSITNHKSKKSRFFCHRRKTCNVVQTVSAWCPSMEETEAQSPTAAVAGESSHLNPPQFASDRRRFRRPACSTHSNFPSSQARRHRTSPRTGCTCASESAGATGTAPGRCSPGANGPLCAHYSGYFWKSAVS